MPLNCATILTPFLNRPREGRVHRRDRATQGAELANRGTLFLDEIAEMTPTTQAALLRVLQERRSVRSRMREQSIDIRRRRDQRRTREAVRQGKLREDLFYRLNVFAIRLPPLRDRKDDIPLLAQAFIKEFNAQRCPSRACRTR